MSETPAPRRRSPRPRLPRDLNEGRLVLDGAYRRADGFINVGERRVFRVLWFFLPETSIAKDGRFQFFMASTFLADGARDAIRYGALIAVVSSGGSAFDAALIAVVSLIPPTLLGLYGGAVADAMPKRVALAMVYSLDAALCFIIPILFGTDMGALMLLLFAVNVLGQVSGPTEQSFTPLVASQAQLATAASLSSLASNVGTVFGTAVLAPVLLKLFGVRAVFYVAGIMLFLATGRILNVESTKDTQKFKFHRPNVNARDTLLRLSQQPAVVTMILVAVLAGTANLVLQTLAPRYVESVLGVDPVDAVYVFGPSALGLVLAIAAAPWLIKKIGERFSALTGFVCISTALCLLGLINHGVADLLDAINPFQLLSYIGIDISPELRAAALLAVPLGFGLSLTTTAVQTYINRRVPLPYQGRTFAVQSTLKNGLAIIPLLTLGGAASVFGVDNVLIVSPFLLLAAAFALLRLSLRYSGHSDVRGIQVLESFWEEPPDTPAEPSEPPDAEPPLTGAPSPATPPAAP